MTSDTPSQTPSKSNEKKPTILVVTPEITYLPEGKGNMFQRIKAKAGGMADVSASLVKALHDQGADVHVALPNYRKMFHTDVRHVHDREYQSMRDSLGEARVHLAQDRVFYHRESVYASENLHMALAFQREVINHIIPEVKPDLIHCNDWMTGLIPAYANRQGIPSLFTIHNIHTERVTMEDIENRGIDAADFWEKLYFDRHPYNYEESRSTNATDLLATGIFSSWYVNSVSRSFLYEVVEGKHDFVPDAIRWQLANKLHAGSATGILNAPDVSYDPEIDDALPFNYKADNVMEGKAINKKKLQERMGLHVDPNAPLFFWPSRLDPMQKGCQLLADVLFDVVSAHDDVGLQVAIIANGEFQVYFRNIVEMHGLEGRVGVVDFEESYSRQGYAGADFMLMPSRFEPCGLPQMVSPKYGTLSIVHNTGGLHDTVEPLSEDGSSGNGFRFDHYSPDGLRWAMEEALAFYQKPYEVKERILSEIMNRTAQRFNHGTTAAAYIKLYESLLGCKVGA